jgi:hypothetical protein
MAGFTGRIITLKNAAVSRIYHSREDRISDLHSDPERVQYDGKDATRVNEVSDTLDTHEANLFVALEEYLNELDRPVDEDSESRMSYARREVIEKWAYAQAALSKVAWVLRFDGNAAYERLINAIQTGDTIDMRGL